MLSHFFEPASVFSKRPGSPAHTLDTNSVDWEVFLIGRLPYHICDVIRLHFVSSSKKDRELRTELFLFCFLLFDVDVTRPNDSQSGNQCRSPREGTKKANAEYGRA